MPACYEGSITIFLIFRVEFHFSSISAYDGYCITVITQVITSSTDNSIMSSAPSAAGVSFILFNSISNAQIQIYYQEGGAF